MAIEVKLPKLAASMEDGVISKWLKAVGEPVNRGEPLFEVESDKVTTEVEAPADGILQQIVVGEGQKIDVGTVLALIAAPGESVPRVPTGSAARSAEPSSVTNGDAKGTRATGAALAVASPPSAAAEVAEKIFITPRARKMAQELGIDIARVRGSGPNGRILERDIVAAAPVASPPVASPTPVQPPVAVPSLPLSGIRRTIAERMLRSQQTVAEVTLNAEVEMAEVVKLREQVSAEWLKLHGFKVTYTEVIVKAVAKALREFPRLNASLTDTGLVEHADVNVGVAVALDDGLIVPVVRNADGKSLLDIARTVKDLGERARKSQLTRDELTGGTFTVTNLGTFGVETFTPIINWPECAILGVGRIAERAVVRDGQIVARPTMWLSLTFDHRIVDGAPATQFLSRVQRLLESPYLLFV
ncbi:MAG TPA: dihydrolipoamide acetyltransferase family protein [Chloroflexota bacterium]|nr:dihydrolipoamide acetyltransferase family protein [Chloroflexota bacterium]